jgi:hypothetical protein
MNRSLRVLVAVLGVVCGSAGVHAQGMNEAEQAIVAALMSGESAGAIIERTGQCATGGPIFEPGSPGPVALVFLGVQDPDGCGNTFTRTNRDGTVDEYRKGTGGAFVILTNPLEFISSEGSYVHWTEQVREGGSITFNANGTLSDGSRMRLHFTINNRGEPVGGRLFIEGRGYIAGAPGAN